MGMVSAFRWSRVRASALVAMAIAAPVRGSDGADSGGGASLVGLTSSARIATLASVIPARIAEFACREGDLVKRGDVLLRLDSAVQEARTELTRAAAESTAEVELATLRWRHAQSEAERLHRLSGESSASSKELVDARHGEALALVELEQARFRHEQARRAWVQEQRALEQYTILAPFDGYVSAHLKRVGEAVDQLEGILTLVELNPLEITLDCPLDIAAELAVGDEVFVRPVAPLWAGRSGTVRLVHRVADGASQTVKAKVVVNNDDLAWMVGVKVSIDVGVAARPPVDASRAAPVITDAPMDGKARKVSSAPR